MSTGIVHGENTRNRYNKHIQTRSNACAEKTEGKVMKKLVALLLAAVLILSLAACGKTANKDDNSNMEKTPSSGLPYEGVTIKFWSPVGDVGYFDEMAKVFYEQTGCTVESTVIPWGEMSTKYVTSFMTGEGPDVFYLTSGLVADLDDGGCLLDLTPYFTEEELAERNFMDACYYNGKMYAVPYNVSSAPRAWAFNLDMLAQVGITEVPATWDALIDAAVKIKDAGICEYPLMLPMNGGAEANLQGFLSLLYSNGGSIANEDLSAITLDSPEALATCQFIYDLVYKYEVLSVDCLSVDAMGASSMFYQGKNAMCTVYAESPLYSEVEDIFYVKNDAGELKQIYKPFEYIITTGVGNNGNLAKCCNPVDTMAVSAKSENLDASVAFLKFLCKEGYQIYYDYYLEVFEDPDAKIIVPPLFKGDVGRTVYHEWHEEMIANMSDHSFVMPIVTGAATMDTVIFSNIQMLVMGEMTPQECVDAMQAECTAAMEG